MKKIKGAIVTIEVTDENSLKELGQEAEQTSKKLDQTGKSTRDVNRNMQHMSGRTESAGKGFSRLQQGTGGLVQAYAILASTIFAVGAAFRALEGAANVDNQIKGFRSLAAITGTSMMEITAGVRAATGGLLDFQTAAQQTAIATAAGFTKDQITGLAEGAKLASVTLGRDLTDSFNRLIRGVTKAEPELLDELGIILRLDIATRAFANANGLVAEKLTISQRRMAVFEEVQRQLIENFGAMESKADEFLNPFSRLSVVIDDLRIRIQGFFLGGIEPIAVFFSNNIAALGSALAAFSFAILRQIVPAAGNITGAFERMRDNAVKAIGEAEKAAGTRLNQIQKVEKQFIASEVKKNQFVKKALKHHGITQKQFNNMRLADQKKTIRFIIAEEEKLRGVTGKVNKQRLTAYRAMLKRIEIAEKNTNMTIRARFTILTQSMLVNIQKIKAGFLGLQSTIMNLLIPAFSILGKIFNKLMIAFTAFFTAKFFFDMLPAVKNINKANEVFVKRLESTNEGLKDMVNTLGSDLKESTMEQLRNTTGELNGELLAANFEITRMANLLKRGPGDNFITDFANDVSEALGQGKGIASSGSLLSFNNLLNDVNQFLFRGFYPDTGMSEGEAVLSGESSPSIAVTNAARDYVSNFMQMVLQGIEDPDTMLAVKTKESFARFLESVLKDGAESVTFANLVNEDFGFFAEIDTILADEAKTVTEKKRNIEFVLQNALGNILKDIDLSSLFRVGAGGGLEFNLEALAAIEFTGLQDARDQFQGLGQVIIDTREGAKSLFQVLQQGMPKPSQAEATFQSIDALISNFVDPKTGKIRDFQIEDADGTKRASSIVLELERELGIRITLQDVIEKYGEEQRDAAEIERLKAELAKEYLETERDRLKVLDAILDTQKTFESVISAQMRMLKFVNTRTSKRQQTELKIIQLQEKMLINAAKEGIKVNNIVDLRAAVADNQERQAQAVQAMNHDLEVQVALLELSLDRLEMLGKNLLETFDKAASSGLTKLLETGDLSEYGGSEFGLDLAKALQKTVATDLANSIIDPITEAMTPEAFKLERDLTPAEQMLEVHGKHITGLTEVFNLHIEGINAAMGNDPTTGKFSVKDITEDGVPEKLKDILDLEEGALGKTFKDSFGKIFGEDSALGKMMGFFNKDITGGAMGAGGFNLGGLLGGAAGGASGAGGIMSLLAGFLPPPFNLLGGLFGGLFAKGGIIGLANGGMIPRYAAGGIAKQPTYLVGEGKKHEAVVPLPDNRSIPVKMNGGGGTNNTNISVNIDQNGNATADVTADGAAQLGEAINHSVMETLVREQRPGGLLNTTG